MVVVVVGGKLLPMFWENMFKLTSVVHHKNRCRGSSFWTTEAENKTAKESVPHGRSPALTENLGNEQI